MPDGLYQTTTDSRNFSVKITDDMARADWDNAANQLCAEFREWLTEAKDAEQDKQAGSDDGSGRAAKQHRQSYG